MALSCQPDRTLLPPSKRILEWYYPETMTSWSMIRDPDYDPRASSDIRNLPQKTILYIYIARPIAPNLVAVA